MLRAELCRPQSSPAWRSLDATDCKYSLYKGALITAETETCNGQKSISIFSCSSRTHKYIESLYICNYMLSLSQDGAWPWGAFGGAVQIEVGNTSEQHETSVIEVFHVALWPLLYSCIVWLLYAFIVWLLYTMFCIWSVPHLFSSQAILNLYGCTWGSR